MGLQCHTALGEDFEVLLLLEREARTATQISHEKEGGESDPGRKKVNVQQEKGYKDRKTGRDLVT